MNKLRTNSEQVYKLEKTCSSQSEVFSLSLESIISIVLNKMIRNCAVVIFAALLAVGLSAVVDKSVKSSKKAFFVNNPSSSDYKLFGKNEEHRYGVELKENNQFHHTTTG